MKKTYLVVLLLLLALVGYLFRYDLLPVKEGSVVGEALITSSGVKLEKKAHYPKFSWDKVPLYMMFADDDRLLTDEEVEKIAGASDFICVEKQHGKKVYGDAVLGLKHETEAFKKVNSKTISLGYFNSAIAYSFNRYTNMLTPDKIDQVPELKKLTLNHPKTGEPVMMGKAFYTFDALNPELRAWWSDAAADMIKESGADGIFIDQMHGHTWLYSKDKKAEVADGVVDMMRQLKQKIGEDKIFLANNGARNERIFEIADAFMFEHYKKEATHTKEKILEDWQLMAKISDAGKICICRYSAPADLDSPLAKSSRMDKKKHKAAEWEELSKKKLPYYLAIYLIGAEPYTYFQWGWGWCLSTGPLVDYPEFNRPLGKPLGKYKRVHPEGWEFTREFEHVSVWIDLEKEDAKLDWR